MIGLADRIARIEPSPTLAMSNRARELRKQGIDVCDLSIGEPDFDTPLHIREAAKQALDAGMTKYAPTAGLPELRKQIAAKLARENALPYTAEQVLVTVGGKQALFNVLFAILGPGDECLIPAPYWVSYPEIVKLAGALPVFLPTSEATGFKVTPQQLDAAVTSRTRALILNSPSNPTGAVYTPGELADLADVISRRRIAVISDEIYEKLIYDGVSHLSIGSLSRELFDLTITCNGFSKAYAATGWRLGYAAGPLHVIKAAADIQSHSTSGATTFAQQGAVAALTAPQDQIEAMRLVFQERRNFVMERLQAIPGLTCQTPAGAFYVFPNISELGVDSVRFCERLLEDAQVAAVPGAAFGSDAHIRLSFATDFDTLDKGLSRLARFVDSLL